MHVYIDVGAYCCCLLVRPCGVTHTGHGLQARDTESHLRDVLLEEVGGGVLVLLALKLVGNGCVVGVGSGAACIASMCESVSERMI